MIKISIQDKIKNIKEIEGFPWTLFCHRIPERTFQINGKYFPVCSRCTGIYITVFGLFIIGMIYYIPFSIPLLILSILLIIPTFIDGVTQLYGLRESNNILRFTTGLLAGAGMALFIVSNSIIHIIHFIINLI